jgi:hypothetical protein
MSAFGISVRSDILDFEAHHVTAPQLAVNRQIEECQIPDPIS